MAIDVERLVAEIDADPAKAIAALKAFDLAAKAAAKDEHKRITVEVDDKELKNASKSVDDFRGKVDGIGGSLLKAHMSMAPLYTLLTALPGAFSTAAAGAGALVGALGPLVGLLGTIPVGLGAMGGGIAAAITGFSGVGAAITGMGSDAAQAAPLMDTMTDRIRQVAMAERALRDARHGAKEAAESLREAEKGLATARHDAKEALQDQRFAVRQAVLSEEQAVLRLKKAQEDLAAAQDRTGESAKSVTQEVDDFTGKVYEVTKLSADAADQAGSEAAAKLELKQAELDLAMARDNTKDQTRALQDMEKKGIKNSDIMVAARERLTDAQWSYKKSVEGVRDAEYALAQARKAAATAATAVAAGTDATRLAMAKLSPEGRRFVRFMVNEFLPAWGDVRKQVQAGLLPGMQRGLRSLMGMFDTIGGGLTKFGTTMGNQFAKFMGHWAEAGNQDRIANTFSNLNGVLRKMLRVATPLSEILLQVTDAATPLTNRVLKGLLRQLRTLDKWMDGKKGKSSMKEFFGDAGDFGGMWMSILGDMVGALAGVVKAAEPLARWLLGDKGLGGFFEKLNDDVNSLTGQDKLTKWFDSWKPSLKEVGGLIGDLLDVLFTSGTGGKDGAFFKTVRSLRDNFVPALGDLMTALDKSDFGPQFAKLLGHITDGITWFVKHDGGLTTAITFLNEIVDVFQRANKATGGGLGNIIGSLVVTLGGLSILARVGTWIRKLLSPLTRLAQLLPGIRTLPGIAPGAGKPGRGEGGFLGTPGSNKPKSGPGKHRAPKGAKPGRLLGALTSIPLPALGALGNDSLPLLPNMSDLDAFKKFLDLTKTAGPDTETVQRNVAGLDIAMLRISQRNPHKALGLLKDIAKETKLPMDDLRALLPKTAKELKWLGANSKEASGEVGNLSKIVNDGRTPMGLAKGEVNKFGEAVKSTGARADVASGKIDTMATRVKNLPSKKTVYLNADTATALERIRKFGNIWDGLSDKQLALQVSRTVTKRVIEEGATPGQPPNRSGGGDWNGGRQRAGITRLVGEHGPELFTPKTSGYISTASETRGLLSGGGGGISPAQIEAMLERVVERARANVKIEQTFNEKVDPMHVGRELAWRLG